MCCKARAKREIIAARSKLIDGYVYAIDKAAKSAHAGCEGRRVLFAVLRPSCLSCKAPRSIFGGCVAGACSLPERSNDFGEKGKLLLNLSLFPRLIVVAAVVAFTGCAAGSSASVPSQASLPATSQSNAGRADVNPGRKKGPGQSGLSVIDGVDVEGASNPIACSAPPSGSACNAYVEKEKLTFNLSTNSAYGPRRSSQLPRSRA